MRLCIRLTILAALLVALAMGLVSLRTDTTQAGNRLQKLFSHKRELEKECCRLELAVARLKSQDRLREQAAGLRAEDTPHAVGAEGNHSSRPTKGAPHESGAVKPHG